MAGYRDRFHPGISEGKRKTVMRDHSEIRESCAREIVEI
jgi:hypothetical protein